MEWLDTIVKVIVLGMLGWALKNYIVERTRKLKPKDVTVTLELLKSYCKEKREERDKTHEALKEDLKEKREALEMKLTAGLAHSVELIDQNLSQGREKFDKLEGSINTLVNKVSDMNTSFRLLKQKIDEKDSVKTTGETSKEEKQ